MKPTKKQFSRWDKCVAENKVKTLEELYKKVHAAIRANPKRVPKVKKQVKHVADPKDKNILTVNGKKYRVDRKLNNQERRVRVNQKIEKFIKERQKK